MDEQSQGLEIKKLTIEYTNIEFLNMTINGAILLTIIAAVTVAVVALLRRRAKQHG